MARRRTPWRENLEAAAGAILLAVMFKYFVLEFYKIPSGSMQPTLLGTGAPLDLYDRVVADKLSYHFRDPARFEVAIFRYPLDRSKNFVKRVWGLPGEEISIRAGDVWVRSAAGEDWHIPRRPSGVMGAHWLRVAQESDRAGPQWTLEPAGDGPAPAWTLERDRVEARGDGAARFSAHGQGPLVDDYLDGYPPALKARLARPPNSGRNPVGDLRLAARVRALPGCRSVAFDLEEGGLLHRFVLPGPAAPQSSAPRLESVPRPGRRSTAEPRGLDAPQPWRLPAGKTVEVEVENLDDRLTLRVGGRELAVLEVARVDHQDSAVRLEVRGEGADLDRLRLWRDVYYEGGRNGSAWPVPADSYFMLGDNTQDSSDSRDWVFGTLAWGPLGEEATSVRGNWRPARPGGPIPADSNPITAQPPGGEPTVFFSDEWGERHTIPVALQRPLPPAEATAPAPFVPRELITGRALASLWPIAPRLGVWRPKWIR